MNISTAEQDFILEWADRWCHLRELIYDYLRTDDSFRFPSQPSESDQFSYQYLRSWFLNNETTFLPLWEDFCASSNWSLDTNNNLIREIEDTEKALKNPFFCWYGPKNLDVFFRAYVIDKQSGRPNEKQAWTIAMNLLALDAIAAVFVMGVCDRT